jgi:hypothetical protein
MRRQSLALPGVLTFVLRCWNRAVNRRQPPKPTAGFGLQPRQSLDRESDLPKERMWAAPLRFGPRDCGYIVFNPVW